MTRADPIPHLESAIAKLDEAIESAARQLDRLRVARARARRALDAMTAHSPAEVETR